MLRGTFQLAEACGLRIWLDVAAVIICVPWHLKSMKTTWAKDIDTTRVFDPSTVTFAGFQVILSCFHLNLRWKLRYSLPPWLPG